jgi:hypothetical protein
MGRLGAGVANPVKEEFVVGKGAGAGCQVMHAGTYLDLLHRLGRLLCKHKQEADLNRVNRRKPADRCLMDIGHAACQLKGHVLRMLCCKDKGGELPAVFRKAVE